MTVTFIYEDEEWHTDANYVPREGEEIQVDEFQILVVENVEWKLLTQFGELHAVVELEEPE